MRRLVASVSQLPLAETHYYYYIIIIIIIIIKLCPTHPLVLALMVKGQMPPKFNHF